MKHHRHHEANEGERLLGIMQNLETKVIPKWESIRDSAIDIAKKARAELKLEELNLEYREVYQAYQEMQRKAREQQIYE